MPVSFSTSSAASPQLKARRLLEFARYATPIAVMSSGAPTRTQGTAGANSTILTDDTISFPVVLPTSDIITAVSGIYADAGSGNYSGSYIDDGAAVSSTGYGFMFEMDSDAFEVKFQNFSTTVFRILVDGQWTQANDYTQTGDGSNWVFQKFVFSAVANRQIGVFSNASAMFGGINVGISTATTIANNKYRAWKSSLAEPRVLVLGDSYTYGNGVTNVRDGWVYKLGEYLGVKGAVASGLGSTGYIATNGGASKTFIQRIADISRFGELDLLVIAGGINDAGSSDAALQAAANATIAAAMAAQPNALIAVVGPWRCASLNPASSKNDSIKAGFNAVAQTARMVYIDTYATPVFQDVTTLNATLYLSGDNIHPNTAGHAYIGKRVGAAVVNWLKSIA